jgi:hypothetical protein
MHLIQDLLVLTDDQIANIQNAYLEAKTINFRKFYIGGEYVFPKPLLDAIKEELEKKDPKINTLVSLLECDPLNLLRLISLGHSPVYIRPSLVPTATSLIQQFGYKRVPKLVEEAAGSPGDRRVESDFFANRALGLEYLQRTIMAAKLAKKIAALHGEPAPVQEKTYMLSVGMNIFEFLLAALNPDLLAAWSIDSNLNQIGTHKNCEKFFIADALENSEDILRKMSLPLKYLQSLSHLAIPPWNKRTWTKTEQEELQIPCSAAYISNEIIDELFTFDYESRFYALVTDIANKCSLQYQALMNHITELPVEMKKVEKMLAVSFPDLPGFIIRLAKKHLEVGTEGQEIAKADRAKIFGTYLSEIKAAIMSFRAQKESRFMFQTVYLCMHTLVKALKFDRAMVLSYDPGSNMLRHYLSFGRGKDLIEDCKIKVEIGKNNVSPAVQAFFDSKVIFHGDPIYEDYWPFVAFPLAFEGEIYGVFYADAASKNKTDALSTDEQMSVISLAELFIK